jgi:hypothetical protein
VSTIITVDTKEHDRLVASTVKAHASEPGCHRGSAREGIRCPLSEHRGHRARWRRDAAELRDITVALAWLSTNRAAKSLTA